MGQETLQHRGGVVGGFAVTGLPVEFHIRMVHCLDQLQGRVGIVGEGIGVEFDADLDLLFGGHRSDAAQVLDDARAVVVRGLGGSGGARPDPDQRSAQCLRAGQDVREVRLFGRRVAPVVGPVSCDGQAGRAGGVADFLRNGDIAVGDMDVAAPFDGQQPTAHAGIDDDRWAQFTERDGDETGDIHRGSPRSGRGRGMREGFPD